MHVTNKRICDEHRSINKVNYLFTNFNKRKYMLQETLV